MWAAGAGFCPGRILVGTSRWLSIRRRRPGARRGSLLPNLCPPVHPRVVRRDRTDRLPPPLAVTRAYVDAMITVDGSGLNHVEISVAAPFTVADLREAGAALRQLAETPALHRVLVVVESIGMPKPKALWEDLKLTPLITHMRWVALVTDIEWYAHLSELTGALSPGLTIKHFEPSDADAALAWLTAHADT